MVNRKSYQPKPGGYIDTGTEPNEHCFAPSGRAIWMNIGLLKRKPDSEAFRRYIWDLAVDLALLCKKKVVDCKKKGKDPPGTLTATLKALMTIDAPKRVQRTQEAQASDEEVIAAARAMRESEMSDAG